MDLSDIWDRWKGVVSRYDDGHSFTCDVCGREVFGGERVCADCEKALPWITRFCPLCGRRVGEEGICLDCKEKPPVVEKARSCFVHEEEAARLIVRYKREERYLFRTLADLTFPLLEREFSEADALTFVPMTERAEKERGYNQSRLLAEELGRRSGKEVLAPAIKRRETKAQKTLGRRERAENLKGCFHVFDRKGVRGRKILIVDDTFTTGATADELAGVLLRAGAAKVFLLTVTSVAKKYPFGIPPKDGFDPKKS